MYQITMKRVDNDHWQVWWNGEMVCEERGENAQSLADRFADGLERGLTGSKQRLRANSKVKIEGWFDYLSVFSSYEEYRE